MLIWIPVSAIMAILNSRGTGSPYPRWALRRVGFYLIFYAIIGAILLYVKIAEG